MNITGQIVTRETGKKMEGKRLIMVVGVLAVPEGTFKGEHQYTVVGEGQPVCDLLTMGVLMNTETDVSETTRGMGLGSIVTQPIWRV